MTCSRCGEDYPEGSRFCPKCGLPAGAVPPAPGSRGMPRWALPAILGAIALAVLGYIAWSNLMGRGSRVVQAPATPPPAGPLTDRSARVQPTAPLTDAPATREPVRADIQDYLRFLEQIEKERVELKQKNEGALTRKVAELVRSGPKQTLGEDGSEQTPQAFSDLGRDEFERQAKWQILAQRFVEDYPKTVPTECVQLRDLYYAVLQKTAASFAEMSVLTERILRGETQSMDDVVARGATISEAVDNACAAAEDELVNVCAQFRVEKRFRIRVDPSGANAFGFSL